MRKHAKTLFVMLSVTILCFVMSMFASAETEGDFKYSVKNNEASITGYVGDGGELVIPDTLGGYKVTSIRLYAFSNCSGLTGDLVIPDGITSIGNYAFSDCSGFTGNLVIPNSVVSIGNGAFSRCSGLTGDLIIPDSVTSIGEYAFNNCIRLTGDLIIPDGVTSIGNYAFSGCSGLTGDLIIPDGVTSIGNYAFSDCSGLTGNLVIPNGVTSIGRSAFSRCHKLTGDLIIPDSVTSIGEYAFYDCIRLTGDLIIPDGVTSVGNYTFSRCSGLTGDLIIPNSVTSIGEYAFSECKNLSSATIPDSVTTIGRDAFYLCYGLKDVYAESAESWFSIVFETYTSNPLCFSNGNLYFNKILATDIVIPDSILTINDHAIRDCNSITSVTIPTGVLSIGHSNFKYCPNLTNITVDTNNQYYSSDEYGVLFNKDKTTLFRYPSGNTRTSYIIPDSVSSIGESAFIECDKLVNIGISDNVVSMGNWAFGYCNSLKNITIPYGINSISDYAFDMCTNLETVILSNCTTSIGHMAFYRCTQIKDVYYAGTKEDFDNTAIKAYNDNFEKATIHYCNIVTTEPACTDIGTVEYVCTECSESIVVKKTDALGHKYSSKVTTQPTHLTEGIETFTCFCGDNYTETIEKLANHTYQKVVTPPTCTSKGYTTYTCECKESYVADYVDTLDHNLSSFVIIKEATCTVNGEERADCLNCDYFETRELIADNHKDEDYDGYCDNCNEYIADKNCSCICHTKGLWGFFYKIILHLHKATNIDLLKKVFTLGQFCKCTVAHY